MRHIAGAWTCMCWGYASRGTCCHILAAASVRTCWHCDHTGADLTVFLVSSDNDAPIDLCSDRAACKAR